MSKQQTTYSPEHLEFVAQVEVALIQAARDARELAERTGTPLVIVEDDDLESGSAAPSTDIPHGK